MTESFYGEKGIDTPYERDMVERKPEFHFPEKESTYSIPPDAWMRIERSKDFKITRAIQDYVQMISEIQELLDIIKNRRDGEDFRYLLMLLNNKKHHDIMKFESEHSGCHQTGDFELYVCLHRMKESLERRVPFLRERFQSQITSEKNDKQAEHAEDQSIRQWQEVESKIATFFEGIEHDDEEAMDKLEKEFQAHLKKKVYLDTLHTSLADTSFVHRNRYMLFKAIINQARSIVRHPQRLIKGKIDILVKQLSTMKDLSAARAHLLFTFRQIKEKHHAIKGQYLMIDDAKEGFASEKNFLYQQVRNKSTMPVRDWLYEQEEEVSQSLDLFSEIMTDSIGNTDKKYEESVANMIQFYKNESHFYEKQISMIQKKEQIRRFYRIIKDLGEAGEATDEWVAEYLKANEYRQ